MDRNQGQRTTPASVYPRVSPTPPNTPHPNANTEGPGMTTTTTEHRALSDRCTCGPDATTEGDRA